jgi:hypothetical protein
LSGEQQGQGADDSAAAVYTSGDSRAAAGVEMHLLDEPLQLLQENGPVSEDDAHLARERVTRDSLPTGQRERTLRSVSSTFWTPEFSLLILAANSLN